MIACLVDGFSDLLGVFPLASARSADNIGVIALHQVSVSALDFGNTCVRTDSQDLMGLTIETYPSQKQRLIALHLCAGEIHSALRRLFLITLPDTKLRLGATLSHQIHDRQDRSGKCDLDDEKKIFQMFRTEMRQNALDHA